MAESGSPSTPRFLAGRAVERKRLARDEHRDVRAVGDPLADAPERAQAVDRPRLPTTIRSPPAPVSAWTGLRRSSTSSWAGRRARSASTASRSTPRAAGHDQPQLGAAPARDLAGRLGGHGRGRRAVHPGDHDPREVARVVGPARQQDRPRRLVQQPGAGVAVEDPEHAPLVGGVEREQRPLVVAGGPLERGASEPTSIARRDVRAAAQGAGGPLQLGPAPRPPGPRARRTARPASAPCRCRRPSGWGMAAAAVSAAPTRTSGAPSGAMRAARAAAPTPCAADARSRRRSADPHSGLQGDDDDGEHGEHDARRGRRRRRPRCPAARSRRARSPRRPGGGGPRRRR